LTAPVFAGVTISLAERLPDANENDPCKVVVVSYTNSPADPNVRAFGLNINLGAGADANITGVKCLSTAYTIYPGTIAIDSQGNITSPGSCLCNKLHAGTPPSKAVTIEMGWLTTAPGESEALAEITIQGKGHVDVNSTLNAIRGGIVMYDATAASSTMGSVGIDLPIPIPPTCISTAAPEYARWVEYGMPDCWCYQKQCRGDINGKSDFTGKPVVLADLTIFKSVYGKTKAEVLAIPGGICADLNHNSDFTGKPVVLADLTIFKTYYGQPGASVPDCDQAPIITGPYNFWKTAP